MWTLLTSKQLSNHQQGRQWRKQNCNVKSRAFARFTSLSAGFKQQPLAIFNKLRRWFSYNSRHTTGSALSWFHCQTMQHFSCGDTSTSTFRDDSSSFKLLWISCEIMGRAKVNRSKNVRRRLGFSLPCWVITWCRFQTTNDNVFFGINSWSKRIASVKAK